MLYLNVTAFSSTSGVFTITNTGTGKTLTMELTSDDTLCMQDAEWIVEDFGLPPQPFADFGNVTFTGATAITAWIGPHVCGGCYEVPAELRAEVAATVPESYAETRWGTPALDIGRGAHAQLAAGGVTDIRWIEGCTREEPRLHSYRRDGAGSGRFAGLIWLEEGR